MSDPSNTAPLRVAIWVPARVGATRLSSKLLRRAAGRPVLAHTLARAVDAVREGLDAEVRLVCDGPELAAVARDLGVPSTLVTETCANGTERLANALRRRPPDDRPEIIVNLQGDEPLVPAGVIARLVEFAVRADADMTTLALPRHCAPHRPVTVVVNRAGRALYFSRAALPGRHPSLPNDLANTAGDRVGAHVGIYTYRAALLERWTELDPSPLEHVEGLEQLRALDHGIALDVLTLATPSGIDAGDRFGHHHPWFAIDTSRDLEAFEELLASSDAAG